MKPPGAVLIRRTVMCAAAAVLAVSAACWLARPNAYRAPQDGTWWVGVSRGCVWGGQPDLSPGKELVSLPGASSLRRLPWYRRVCWRPQIWTDPSYAGFWAILIPLWIPAGGASIVLGSAFFISRRERIRVQDGHCPSCGYDLTGITGPCPECGAMQRLDSTRFARG